VPRHRSHHTVEMDTGKDGSEMKPEDRKRLKQHIEMIVDHKMPEEDDMSEINLYYPDIKKSWEDANVSIDDMMFAYTQDIADLQARIAELESDIPFEQVCKKLEELEARWKIAETDVMDIVGSALSGDCEKYQYFDRNGHRYVRWGRVGNDLRAIFYNHTDIVDEMSVDVKNTNPDYYNHDETSSDNNKGESNE